MRNSGRDGISSCQCEIWDLIAATPGRLLCLNERGKTRNPQKGIKKVTTFHTGALVAMINLTCCILAETVLAARIILWICKESY